MYKIASQLSLCGEPIDDAHMIEKILFTFYAANIILAQQYRNMRFTKYSNLMSMLLLAEKQNKLLLKNHGERPTRTLLMQTESRNTCVDDAVHIQRIEEKIKVRENESNTIAKDNSMSIQATHSTIFTE